MGYIARGCPGPLPVVRISRGILGRTGSQTLDWGTSPIGRPHPLVRGDGGSGASLDITPDSCGMRLTGHLSRKCGAMRIPRLMNASGTVGWFATRLLPVPPQPDIEGLMFPRASCANRPKPNPGGLSNRSRGCRTTTWHGQRDRRPTVSWPASRSIPTRGFLHTSPVSGESVGRAWVRPSGGTAAELTIAWIPLRASEALGRSPSVSRETARGSKPRSLRPGSGTHHCGPRFT